MNIGMSQQRVGGMCTVERCVRLKVKYAKHANKYYHNDTFEILFNNRNETRLETQHILEVHRHHRRYCQPGRNYQDETHQQKLAGDTTDVSNQERLHHRAKFTENDIRTMETSSKQTEKGQTDKTRVKKGQ